MEEAPPPLRGAQRLVDLQQLAASIFDFALAEFVQLSSSAAGQSENDRKRQLLQHLHGTRQQLLRLLALLNWKPWKVLLELVDHERVLDIAAGHDRTLATVVYQMQQQASGRITTGSYLNMYDVNTALEVLTTGTYQELPSVILHRPPHFQPPPASLTRQHTRLAHVTKLVRDRLAQMPLPPGLKVVSVGSGVAVLRAEGLYEAKLTLVPSEPLLGKEDEAGAGVQGAGGAGADVGAAPGPSCAAGGAAGGAGSVLAALAAAAAADPAAVAAAAQRWKWRLIHFVLRIGVPFYDARQPGQILNTCNFHMVLAADNAAYLAQQRQLQGAAGATAGVATPQPATSVVSEGAAASGAPAQAGGGTGATGSLAAALKRVEGDEAAAPLAVMHAILSDVAGRLLADELASAARALAAPGSRWHGHIAVKPPQLLRPGVRLEYWTQAPPLVRVERLPSSCPGGEDVARVKPGPPFLELGMGEGGCVEVLHSPTSLHRPRAMGVLTLDTFRVNVEEVLVRAANMSAQFQLLQLRHELKPYLVSMGQEPSRYLTITTLARQLWCRDGNAQQQQQGGAGDEEGQPGGTAGAATQGGAAAMDVDGREGPGGAPASPVVGHVGREDDGSGPGGLLPPGSPGSPLRDVSGLLTDGVPREEAEGVLVLLAAPVLEYQVSGTRQLKVSKHLYSGRITLRPGQDERDEGSLDHAADIAASENKVNAAALAAYNKASGEPYPAERALKEAARVLGAVMQRIHTNTDGRHFIQAARRAALHISKLPHGLMEAFTATNPSLALTSGGYPRTDVAVWALQSLPFPTAFPPLDPALPPDTPPLRTPQCLAFFLQSRLRLDSAHVLVVCSCNRQLLPIKVLSCIPVPPSVFKLPGRVLQAYMRAGRAGVSNSLATAGGVQAGGAAGLAAARGRLTSGGAGGAGHSTGGAASPATLAAAAGAGGAGGAGGGAAGADPGSPAPPSCANSPQAHTAGESGPTGGAGMVLGSPDGEGRGMTSFPSTGSFGTMQVSVGGAAGAGAGQQAGHQLVGQQRSGTTAATSVGMAPSGTTTGAAAAAAPAGAAAAAAPGAAADAAAGYSAHPHSNRPTGQQVAVMIAQQQLGSVVHWCRHRMVWEVLLVQLHAVGAACQDVSGHVPYTRVQVTQLAGMSLPCHIARRPGLLPPRVGPAYLELELGPDALAGQVTARLYGRFLCAPRCAPLNWRPGGQGAGQGGGREDGASAGFVLDVDWQPPGQRGGGSGGGDRGPLGTGASAAGRAQAALGPSRPAGQAAPGGLVCLRRLYCLERGDSALSIVQDVCAIIRMQALLARLEMTVRPGPMKLGHSQRLAVLAPPPPPAGAAAAAAAAAGGGHAPGANGGVLLPPQYNGDGAAHAQHLPNHLQHPQQHPQQHPHGVKPPVPQWGDAAPGAGFADGYGQPPLAKRIKTEPGAEGVGPQGLSHAAAGGGQLHANGHAGPPHQGAGGAGGEAGACGPRGRGAGAGGGGGGRGLVQDPGTGSLAWHWPLLGTLVLEHYTCSAALVRFVPCERGPQGPGQQAPGQGGGGDAQGAAPQQQQQQQALMIHITWAPRDLRHGPGAPGPGPAAAPGPGPAAVVPPSPGGLYAGAGPSTPGSWPSPHPHAPGAPAPSPSPHAASGQPQAHHGPGGGPEYGSPGAPPYAGWGPPPLLQPGAVGTTTRVVSGSSRGGPAEPFGGCFQDLVLCTFACCGEHSVPGEVLHVLEEFAEAGEEGKLLDALAVAAWPMAGLCAALRPAVLGRYGLSAEMDVRPVLHQPPFCHRVVCRRRAGSTYVIMDLVCQAAVGLSYLKVSVPLTNSQQAAVAAAAAAAASGANDGGAAEGGGAGGAGAAAGQGPALLASLQQLVVQKLGKQVHVSVGGKAALGGGGPGARAGGAVSAPAPGYGSPLWLLVPNGMLQQAVELVLSVL